MKVNCPTVELWPVLPWEEWKDTARTLHMWMQVVGKTRYNDELKEFILKYDDVRRANSPDDVVLEFPQSSYEAAAELAGWDRGALERLSDQDHST